MPVAAVTRAVMAKPCFVPRFVWANLICTIQARRTTGLLNGTLAVSPKGPVFWTLTVWQDGPAMMRFRDSELHLKFIPKMANWGSEASTAAWKVADGRLPTWDEAYEALRTRGRFAPVEAPNINQRNGIITPPSRVILTVPLLRRRVIRHLFTVGQRDAPTKFTNAPLPNEQPGRSRETAAARSAGVRSLSKPRRKGGSDL